MYIISTINLLNRERFNELQVLWLLLINLNTIIFMLPFSPPITKLYSKIPNYNICSIDHIVSVIMC